MKKTKLKKLLNRLESFDTDVEETFLDLESELASISSKLKESINAKTVEKATEQFKKILSLISPLAPLIQTIKEEEKLRGEGLLKHVDERAKEVLRISNALQTATSNRVSLLSADIADVKIELNKVAAREIEIPDYAKDIKKVEMTLTDAIESIQENIDTYATTTELKDSVDKIRTLINQTRDELSRHGGGAMGRQIKINGTDYLTRYTDINLIGSITAAENLTHKRVDITFTGGGSSFQQPTSGSVNGVNQEFVWAVEPDVIFRDGVAMQKVSSDGTENWTGTTTTTLTIAPNFDIFGL